MWRRLLAGFFAFFCPPLAFLYAGWLPVAVLALLVAPTVVVVPFTALAVGVIGPEDLVVAFGAAWCASWVLPPLLAVGLPPRTGRPFQRLPVYLLAWPVALVYQVLTVVALRAFVAEPYQIPTAAMAPALLPGDYIVALKSGAGARPEAGRVIVFRHPTQGVVYVSRVAATAGQEIAVRDGVIVIDGAEVPTLPVTEASPDMVDAHCAPLGERVVRREVLGGHTYTTRTHPVYAEQIRDFEPATVPADHLFVVSDNRDDAVDSRIFGPVPEALVLGVISDRWLSMDPCTQMPRSERVGPVP